MKFLAGLLLLAGVASAQILSIACGSPVPVGVYAADEYFSGGTARPKDTTIGTGIYQTNRYSNGTTAFSYHIPMPAGTYNIVLNLNDPTSTAAGQRVFTVTVNGNKSAPIDIFAAVGARSPYSSPIYIADAGAGFIDITFQSTKGNATVSGIQIFPNIITLPVEDELLFCVYGEPCLFPSKMTP